MKTQLISSEIYIAPLPGYQLTSTAT